MVVDVAWYMSLLIMLPSLSVCYGSKHFSIKTSVHQDNTDNTRSVPAAMLHTANMVAAFLVSINYHQMLAGMLLWRKKEIKF